MSGTPSRPTDVKIDRLAWATILAAGLATAPAGLAAQGTALSLTAGLSTGDADSRQLQVRVRRPLGLPVYARVGARKAVQSCEDSFPASCDLPGDGSLEAAAGVALDVRRLGPLAVRFDVGAGVARWSGTDPLLEAQVALAGPGPLLFGLRGETILVGERSTSSPQVPEHTLAMVGFFVGIELR